MNFPSAMSFSNSFRDTKWYSFPSVSPALGLRLVSSISRVYGRIFSYVKLRTQKYLDVSQTVGLIESTFQFLKVRRPQLGGILNSSQRPHLGMSKYLALDWSWTFSRGNVLRAGLGLPFFVGKKGVNKSMRPVWTKGDIILWGGQRSAFYFSFSFLNLSCFYPFVNLWYSTDSLSLRRVYPFEL